MITKMIRFIVTAKCGSKIFKKQAQIKKLKRWIVNFSDSQCWPILLYTFGLEDLFEVI